jgi:hypothetical protein
VAVATRGSPRQSGPGRSQNKRVAAVADAVATVAMAAGRGLHGPTALGSQRKRVAAVADAVAAGRGMEGVGRGGGSRAE